MNVKITYIKIFDTDKTGQPLTGQWGPYSRVSIKTDTHGDKYLSASVKPGSPLLAWKVGETHEIDVTQKGEYLNFTPTKKAAVASGQVTEKLFIKLDLILQIVQNIQKQVGNLETVELEEPPQEVNVEDIPF